ncbi:tail fiber assembly protein [Escherichia coli]|nr:tail fiber assembly protein [Escherichia coli]ELO3125232.1 tail fiber assembly protein [Escherichia coli]ELO3193024.1 tail fiber assembly protein [Escherichia coli]MED9434020.1 tail fiber assembly protein [Escherichia coli]
MLNIKNFKPYIPENTDTDASYLISEDGQDWYECQKLFSPETVKVAYDNNNTIIGFSLDVSALFPVNASVAEVAANEVPEAMVSADGNWLYLDGKIVQKLVDYRQKAEEHRRWLYSRAADITSDWKAELILEIIRDDDKEQLKAWLLYARALKSLDFSQVTDESSYNAIEWPVPPQNI